MQISARNGNISSSSSIKISNPYYTVLTLKRFHLARISHLVNEL